MLYSLDLAIFQFINQTCQNPVLDKLMPLVTKLGEGETLFFIACLLLFFPKIRRQGITLLAGLTVTFQVTRFIKHLVQRPRPFEVLSNVHLLTPEKNFSFPSTHAAMAFMATIILTSNLNKGWIKILGYFIAILVCVSRPYLAVHYPSDVFAGAILGLGIGWLLNKK